MAAIQGEVPEYSRPLRGDFGRGIVTGVEQALRRFLAEADGGEAGGAGSGTGSGGIYRALGRGEHRAGRSLDALQAAYRVGARVAWRRVSRLAAAAGTPVEAQHELAEAIFAYIDQLAAESVEGYAEAQAVEAGSMQRRREELLVLLLAQPPVPASAIGEAAGQAGWRLPRRVAMIAVPADAAARVARRLSGEVLHAAGTDHGRIAVPDPGGVHAELVSAAGRYRVPAGLGPAVPLIEAGRSWRWAELASRRASAGAVVEAETRLPELLLEASPDIVSALADRALAPLRAETQASRLRLEATLRTWLRHRGAQGAAALELGVHPQTVRYRMARLRELFGTDLEDPERRFALELALRAGEGYGVPI